MQLEISGSSRGLYSSDSSDLLNNVGHKTENRRGLQYKCDIIMEIYNLNRLNR